MVSWIALWGMIKVFWFDLIWGVTGRTPTTSQPAFPGANHYTAVDILYLPSRSGRLQDLRLSSWVTWIGVFSCSVWGWRTVLHWSAPQTVPPAVASSRAGLIFIWGWVLVEWASRQTAPTTTISRAVLESCWGWRGTADSGSCWSDTPPRLHLLTMVFRLTKTRTKRVTRDATQAT